MRIVINYQNTTKGLDASRSPPCRRVSAATSVQAASRRRRRWIYVTVGHFMSLPVDLCPPRWRLIARRQWWRVSPSSVFGGGDCSGGVSLCDSTAASVVGVRRPCARRWSPLVVGKLHAKIRSPWWRSWHRG
jgi:hypothetical protein